MLNKNWIRSDQKILSFNFVYFIATLGPQLSILVQYNIVTYNGDAYAMGINDEFFEIHKLSCPKEKCEWTRIKQERLQGRSGRSIFLAFPVTDSFANCT